MYSLFQYLLVFLFFTPPHISRNKKIIGLWTKQTPTLRGGFQARRGAWPLEVAVGDGQSSGRALVLELCSYFWPYIKKAAVKAPQTSRRCCRSWKAGSAG